jgi:hypothetical protein
MENANFKYFININQYAAFKLFGNDIDYNDLAIFDFIKDFANSKQCVKMIYEGKSYFMLTRKIVMQNLPLLGISTDRGISKRLDKLCGFQIIERYPNNQLENVSYFTFGKNYDNLIFSPMNESSNVPMNESSHLRTFVHTPMNESSNVPMNESSNDNIYNVYKRNNLKEDSFSCATEVALESEADSSLKNLQASEQVESALDAQETPTPHVAPAPPSPITLEELVAIAQEQGCNGKSEAFAGEFYYLWQGKNWEINANGAKMRNPKKRFEEFLASKNPKEKAHPAYTKCVALFHAKHVELKGRDFKGFGGKDGTAMNQIIVNLKKEIEAKIRQENDQNNTITIEDGEVTQTNEKIEVTQEQIEHGFAYMMQHINHEWVIRNFSLPNINSKFNDIINQIRENHNGTTPRNSNKNQDASTRTQEYIRNKYGNSFGGV